MAKNLMLEVLKVELFYWDKTAAFTRACQLISKSKKYSGIYVFKPDEAETPIDRFYYVVVAYAGQLDVLSKEEIEKLWDLSMGWLKAEKKTLKYKLLSALRVLHKFFKQFFFRWNR